MPTHALNDDDEPVRARVPADLDTPDQLIAGFTPGQILTLVVLGTPVLLIWNTLAGQVPAPVLLGGSIPVLAGSLTLVLARRDGLPLDRWLLAAVRYRTGPRLMRASTDLSPGFGLGPDLGRSHRRRQSPGRQDGPHGQMTQSFPGRAVPAPLAGVTEDGVMIHASGRHSALIACTTVPTALSTHQDDAILASGMARWLNSLSGPVQIVVRNRPANLAAMASGLTSHANRMDNPALAALALDHAETLLDTYETDRPLHRTVLIACSGGVSSGPEQAMQNLAQLRRRFAARLSPRSVREGRWSGKGGLHLNLFVSARASAEALSRAQRTVGELQSLGARAEILDGWQVQQVLAEAWTPCLLRPDSLSADLMSSADISTDPEAVEDADGFTETETETEALGGLDDLPPDGTYEGQAHWYDLTDDEVEDQERQLSTSAAENDYLSSASAGFQAKPQRLFRPIQSQDSKTRWAER